jgi:hypothetical protein
MGPAQRMLNVLVLAPHYERKLALLPSQLTNSKHKFEKLLMLREQMHKKGSSRFLKSLEYIKHMALHQEGSRAPLSRVILVAAGSSIFA